MKEVKVIDSKKRSEGVEGDDDTIDHTEGSMRRKSGQRSVKRSNRPSRK